MNSTKKLISDFGDEWEFFDQTKESLDLDLMAEFNKYFSIFPFGMINETSVGIDYGCGSGRWAKFIAPRVKKLFCVDASDKALLVSMKNLKSFRNVVFQKATIEELSFEKKIFDFGYSLGVLHHVPDTQSALNSCVKYLKPGAPFLVYLYYRFDNRKKWYKVLHSMTEPFRLFISRSPFNIKVIFSFIVATLIYFPLARLSALLLKYGVNIDSMPLSSYRNRTFYSMWTDALDRFGTRLEHRFTKHEISVMMRKAGLVNIEFSDNSPFWCAIGYVKN